MSVYLDHAATTPLRPEARDAWLEASAVVGNASSIHGSGQRARRILEDARDRVAAAVDCEPIEVVFTSGGTESINLAVTGLLGARRASGYGTIVAPEGEHHATLDTLQWFAGHGDARVTWVGIQPDGVLDLARWRTAVAAPDVALATLLAANNETGARQPVRDAAIAAAEAGVPLHVDAVSAFGHVPVAFRQWRTATGSRGAGLVAMSIAAHKIGGPVGLGALIVARETTLTPLQHGGGHQRGLRAGTQDVAGAAAFAIAAELAIAELDAEAVRLAALRDRLEAGIRATIPEAVVSAGEVDRLPGTLHVVFPGAQGDSLLLLLDAAGIAVSTGSACQAGTPEPSHVLLAMGRSAADARSALRLTLGRTSTSADIDAVLAALPPAYARARRAGLS